MSSKSVSEKLQEKIKEKVAQIACVAPDIPGIVIIYNISTNSVEYISPRGLEILSVSLEEIKKGGSDYQSKFLNPEDVKDYLPKIAALLERNNINESTCIFQQVKAAKEQEWVWHICSVKIIMQDEQQRPLLAITLAFPIDTLQNSPAKMDRLVEENNFKRKNYHSFNKLGTREREVLRLLALGKSSPETAEILFITNTTVETHRKNIKQKLQTSSFFELCQYARAFDLI